MNKISVYALNLPNRVERLKSIQKQFDKKSEYDFQVISAIKHPIGAYGQWKSLIRIVKQEIEKNSDFFIFCEDDHVFTKDYNFEYLSDSIKQADRLGADFLCGGGSLYSGCDSMHGAFILGKDFQRFTVHYYF